MKKFVYQRPKVSLIKRIRIKEDRDLKKGIRLNRNERVENFDKKIFTKIFENIKDYDPGKYPDQSQIYKVLSRYLKVKRNEILISSGIDGSIKSIFEIFTQQNDKIAVLDPTYAMYRVYSNIFKTKLVKINYNNFKLDRKKLFKLISYSNIKILFIPNPNQPIEDNLTIKEIKKILSICKKNKILVVIDEAYHMFGSVSAINLRNKFENLLVLRTFSKSFGLPSIRFGFIIGNSKIIQILNSYRLSYESNFFSDLIVKYFIQNQTVITNYIKKVKKGRDFLRKKLVQIDIDVYGKNSNFLLINFKNESYLKRILKTFSQKKIYVKSNYSGELKNCILLTCGPTYIMKKIFDIIKKEIQK